MSFQIVERGLEKAVVLEDDVRFGVHFKTRLLRLMVDLEQVQLSWDLMYVGDRHNLCGSALELQRLWKSQPQSCRALAHGVSFVSFRHLSQRCPF